MVHTHSALVAMHGRSGPHYGTMVALHHAHVTGRMSSEVYIYIVVTHNIPVAQAKEHRLDVSDDSIRTDKKKD